jgi:hypothetical protein
MFKSKGGSPLSFGVPCKGTSVAQKGVRSKQCYTFKHYPKFTPNNVPLHLL